MKVGTDRDLKVALSGRVAASKDDEALVLLRRGILDGDPGEVGVTVGWRRELPPK